MLMKANSGRISAGKVGANGEATECMSTFKDFFGIDRRRPCVYCKDMMITGGEDANVKRVNPRHFTVHRLMHGSTGATVAEIRCHHCQKINWYEGRCEGLFVYCQVNVFSRELLDYWLYGIAPLGGTFRETLELSRAFSQSSSAEFTRWGGKPLSCSRKHGNCALSLFLNK